MKRVLFLILFAFALTAGAQVQLEVIRLKSRTVEQVLPSLQPLVEPGGALTGSGNSLFLRASAANCAEIKRALAALDTPLRRLMITVRQDNDFSGEARGAELSGSIGNDNVRIEGRRSPDPRGGNVEIRRGDDVVRGQVYSSRGRADDRVTQQVQTVEGGRAFIQVGYSLPIPLRNVTYGPGGAFVSESVVYRDLGTGFYAQPMVAGNNVTIEISPQQESLSGTVEGAVRSSRLTTTVSGRLGQWIALGGTNQDLSQDRSGTLSYSTRGSLEQRRVLLRVEELP
jgi:type II secretory pathway component GspD/PulD (secretin)